MGQKKYSPEFKLEVVEQHLKKHIGADRVAKEYHVSSTQVREWIDAYLEHGEAGLCASSQSYSGDFKVSVVEYMHSTGYSPRKTAAHFNIHSRKTVLNWERIYKEQGKEALYMDRRKKAKQPKDTNSEEKSYEELKAEVEELRMENEYLKKLRALVQEREESEKKTK